MKLKFLLSILLIVNVFFGYGKTEIKSDTPLNIRLQTAMDESLKNSGAIGVSVAIILPDGKMWKGASGISHKGVPVTTEMLFDIGSIEKNFQAALALKLVEENLISLNDPLDKWFPTYPNINGKIKIRNLLNMTSGIDMFVSDSNSPWRIGYDNINFEKMWTWKEIYSKHIGEPQFEPGEKCEYTTTNYIVLKLIIEKATQSKQTTEFHNRLLKPNKLNQTLTDFINPIPKNIQIAHAWLDSNGDGKVKDIFKNSLNWIATMSPMLVYSTPSDMVRWMDALYHKKTVLGKKMLKEMLNFYRPVQNEPLMKGYGLGVVDINLGAFNPDWKSVKAIGHLGSQYGYTAFAAYFPEYKVSISFLFNRGADKGALTAIMPPSLAVMNILFEHLGVKKPKPKD